MIAVINALISEALNDSSSENNVILKKRIFIEENKIICYDCVYIPLYSLEFIFAHKETESSTIY